MATDDNAMPLTAIDRLSELVEQAIASAGGQRALARRTGISQSTISKWLTKQVREWPLFGHLQGMAKYLGMSLGDFLDYLERGGELPDHATVSDIIGNIESQDSLSYLDAMRLNAAIAKKALEGKAEAEAITSQVR
jgi:transcriptional regulator with XRE-family HTH domain